MQIIRSSKSLYTEAENLIRSVAKAACPVNPPSTHPIIQRIVWWYKICWVWVLLLVIARLVPHPICKVPRPVPKSIGPQLESGSWRYRCGLGSRRAVTHVRRIRWCSCRWHIWFRGRQQPSRRWTRRLLWSQADSCRLSRSWLIPRYSIVASGGIGKSTFSLSVSILSRVASCLRDLLELFSAM